MSKKILILIIVVVAICSFLFLKSYFADLVHSDVRYGSRDYAFSAGDNKMSKEQIEKKFGEIISTGEFIKGYEIYISKGSSNSPFDPTVIFLKNPEGVYRTYSLRGGP